MRHAFALLFLPFVLLATNEPSIEGQVVPSATHLYQDATVIHLPCGIDLDTRDASAAQTNLPANLMLSAEQEGTGTYLVQFDGPIYSHERDALEQEGVTIVAYLPNYAYMVRMDASKKSQVASLEGVRWMGNYEPGYKICPEINLAGQEPEKFVVLLYAGIDAETIRKDVETLGGEVLESQATEWKTIVHVMLAPNKTALLVQNPNIRWIEPFLEMRLLNGQAQWVIQTWQPDSRRIWDKGIKGQGQIVSTLDSGIRTTHNFFRDPAVSITDFGDYPSHRKITGYQKPAYDPDGTITFGDESGHGTHTAGSVTGNDQPVGGSSVNIGMAPEAKIFFLDGGSASNPGGIIHAVSLEYSLSLAYIGNTAGGARIISNSWGGTSRSYDASCVEADQTMWDYPDYLVCFAGGNNPPSTYTGTPGNAKDVLCVGGCRNGIIANIVWTGASNGPSGDGRIRPDIVTPGDGVTSSYFGSDDAEVAWSGTSMSTPIAAGNATLVRQYFTDGWYPSGTPQNSQKFTPSAALVKGMMINSVQTDYSLNPVPDPHVGWGRPKLDNVLYFPGDSTKLALVDFTEGLGTGYQFLGKVNVSGNTEPLRITLNWTDYPGAEFASPALVNDLNLEVESPSGKIYRGNNFASNVSIEDGSFDTKNPTENVFVDAPETGEWKVSVQANNVPQGPQPFALVVTGGLGTLITSATISDVEVDDAGQSNPNGNMDPGENVTIYVTIKNTSNDALHGVSATLATLSPYITITDNSASYGTLDAGNTAPGDGFKVTVSSYAPLDSLVEFEVNLSSTELSGELGSFELIVGTPKYAWVSHDIGNVKLTVTDQGSIGYTSPPGTTGSKGEGFRYPKTASSWLYYSSFAAGNSKDYIVDRFYGDDANYTNAQDWNVVTSPDGRVIIGRRDISDQDSRAIFDDAGAESPKGLTASQYGYAWEAKDFVILKYVLTNTGTSALDNMYAGIIADYDMGTVASSNYAGTDQTLNLAYEKQSSTDKPHVGVKLLKGQKANVSILENPVYVYQESAHVWNDEYCFRFISGDLSFASDPDSTDWSIVVSAGPFNLAAGTTDTVAFAFLAGDDLSDLKDNAQDAQTTWDNLVFGPAVEEGDAPLALDLSFSPELFKGKGSILFSLPQASRVRLDVYDISGRLVRNLLTSEMPGGNHEIYWDGRDSKGLENSTGIYFITLATKDVTLVRKAVILK